MITLDLFESAPNNNDPKQPGRVEKPAIAGTDKTAKSGYYPKPAAPVQKLAQPTNKFDKVAKEGMAETDNFRAPAAMMKGSPRALSQAQGIIQQQADKNVIGQAKIAGAIPNQGMEEAQLDEIGDTPAGRAALSAVGQRADDTMAAWAANPKSGYSSTPSAVAKASQAGVSASNRLYGFGPDKSKTNTVMARDALRKQQAQRGMMEQGIAEAQSEPEQQQMDANRRAALRREREPEGSEKIDARLAQQHAQRQEYEKTGKFWLKQKDTQQHISDAYTGKAAANAAALNLLKQRPELRGNLVITAYGPDEQQDVKEAGTRFSYPEGSENLGRANMELLIRAYNEPTSDRITLYFGNKAVDLDRKDIEAIADYYDDRLPTNDARWNFIRAVMNNYDNFQTVLNKIGRRSAVAIRQPGLFQEADKKKDDDDLGAVKDVALQRAISKAKADFPTAGSGLEALAKDFMKSQEQDRRDFEQLQGAERQHDQLLSQISKIDQEQEQEIDNLETQNSALSQRLQQLQNVNSELEKKLSAMTGRKEKRQATKLDPSDFAAPAVAMPTVVPRKSKGKSKPQVKKQATPKSNVIKARPSAAIGNVAQQLAPGAPAQLPAPGDIDVLPAPPTFKRDISPELIRGKETATDAEFIDMPVMQKTAARAQATAENKKHSDKGEADYGDEYQAMVRRVGQLAKSGPLKTVWDPVKRVYKVVPVNQTKNVKEHEPSVQGRDAIKNVSDWAERLRVAHELEKDVNLMADPEAKAAVHQQVKELLAYGIQQGYVQ